MTLPLALAAVDAAAAALLRWALRRERRDKPALVAVGLVLSICAVFLAVIGLAPDDKQPSAVGPAPGTPV